QKERDVVFHPYVFICLKLDHQTQNKTGDFPLSPVFTYSSNAFIKFAISIAAVAASAPLFPAFVPPRSIACSIVSVVAIPKITGVSVWTDAFSTPLPPSLQTYS